MKKLYRSRKDRIIAGVCGGLGEYFNLDPTLIRIAFAALTLLNGAGLILYIILSIVIPEEKVETVQEASAVASASSKGFEGSKSQIEESEGTKAVQNLKNGKQNSRVVFGIALIMLGFYFLLEQIFPWLHIRWQFVWPLVIVFIGLLIIFKPEK